MYTQTHPKSGLQIEGVRLPAGSVILDTDHYNGSSGGWLRAGPATGLKIEHGCKTVWVRSVGPLSADARTLLAYLRSMPQGPKTCIGRRRGGYYVIPSPTFNWDGRIDIESKRVEHPECVVELALHGYIEEGEYAISHPESDYAAVGNNLFNTAFVLTDSGQAEAQN